MKTFVAFTLLATVVAPLLTMASPIKRSSDTLNCQFKFTGPLSFVQRNPANAPTFLAFSRDQTIVIDTGEYPKDAQGSDKQYRDQFSFFNCTAGDYNRILLSKDVGVIQPGALKMLNQAQGCLTATPDAPGTVNRLVRQACATSSNDNTLARQWFHFNDFSSENGGQRTVELVGGPDGSYAYPSVDTVPWGDQTAVIVTPKDTGKVLAISVDSKELS